MTKSLRDGGLQLLGLGTLLAFIGIAMLSPLVSKPVASAVGRLFSRRLPGRLGRENAVRNPRRTAATAAALMIGLALISAVTVLGSSLKASVAKTVAGAVTADFILNTQGPGFPDAVVGRRREAGRRPQHGSGQGRRRRSCATTPAAATAKQVFVTAFPADAIGDLVNITTVDGSDDLAPDTILMSESAAESRKLSPGDKVRGAVRPVRAGDADARRHLRDQPADRRLPGRQLQGRRLLHPARRGRPRRARRRRRRRPRSARSLDSALKEYPNVEVLDQSEFVGEAKTRSTRS